MKGGMREKYRVFIELFMYIFGFIAFILLLIGYIKNIVGHTDQYDNITTPGWVFTGITGALILILILF